MTPLELHLLNCAAYKRAIEAAEARGDSMKAVDLRRELRALEQRGAPDCRPAPT